MSDLRHCPKCTGSMEMCPSGFQNGVRRWRMKCLPCEAIRSKGYRGSEKTAFNRAYQNRYPEKRAAHKAVERALMKGLIKKSPCAVCSKPHVEAHHEDYAAPLEVTWLCPFHHLQRHRQITDIAVAEQFARAAE